jgi:DNA-binding transcriptional LysR family regulator
MLLTPSLNIHGNDWQFEAPDGTCEVVHVEPAYTVNDAVMQRHAALAGMGIAILSSDQVDADKALSLIYPGRRHVPAKTRAFVDFTVDWFRQRESRAALITDTLRNN